VVGLSSSFASLTLKDSQGSHFLVPHGRRWVCLVHATLVSLTRKVVPPLSYIHILSLSQKQDSGKCLVLENHQMHLMEVKACNWEKRPNILQLTCQFSYCPKFQPNNYNNVEKRKLVNDFIFNIHIHQTYTEPFSLMNTWQWG